jgi:hypothetical protein
VPSSFPFGKIPTISDNDLLHNFSSLLLDSKFNLSLDVVSEILLGRYNGNFAEEVVKERCLQGCIDLCSIFVGFLKFNQSEKRYKNTVL